MIVYVAAPYLDAERVRAVHAHLRALGCTPSSRWAESATGPEDFSSERIQQAIEQNDADVLRSQAMLVLAREGAGGEMFAEARLAAVHSIPIVWVGRLTLSAWRPGVTRCPTLEDGIIAIRILSVLGK